MAVEITDAALKQFKNLIAAEKMPADGYVRVGVKGGGCSGYSYVFDFDAKRRLNDRVFQKDGIKVVVDPKSYPLLDGMTLDFEKTIMTQAFVFKNPNAKSTCGCGVSFGV